MEETVFDLCIVGAGMFGSAAARHASAFAGVKVCLVGPDEPKPEEMISRDIFGAHYDEGRITRTVDKSIPMHTLSKNSIKRYRELEELSGMQFYCPVGSMIIGKKDEAFIKSYLEACNISNIPFVDLSTNNVVKRRYPFLQFLSDDHVLLDDSGAGHISPRNMVAAQKKVAKCQGCFLVNDTVDQVTPSLEDGYHKILCQKGVVLQSKRVLICTGAFTNLKRFPIPKLKINIYKETVVFFKLPIDEAERLSSMATISYSPAEDDIGAYVLPPIRYPDGNYYLKIGHLDFEETDNLGTLTEIKEWYLSKGDPKKIEKLSTFLNAIIPGLRYDKVTSATCVTCGNPSELPYIDRVTPTVTVAVVGNGVGAKFSDEVGRIAAHLSVTGQWNSELSQSHFKIIVDE